jgi:hypothetical protein
MTITEKKLKKNGTCPQRNQKQRTVESARERRTKKIRRGGKLKIFEGTPGPPADGKFMWHLLAVEAKRAAVRELGECRRIWGSALRREEGK